MFQGRGGVSGLDGRVFTQIARGMGLSPTWHYTFPWQIRMFSNIINILLIQYQIKHLRKNLAEGRCLHMQKWQMSCADAQDRCADVLN